MCGPAAAPVTAPKHACSTPHICVSTCRMEAHPAAAHLSTAGSSGSLQLRCRVCHSIPLQPKMDAEERCNAGIKPLPLLRQPNPLPIAPVTDVQAQKQDQDILGIVSKMRRSYGRGHGGPSDLQETAHAKGLSRPSCSPSLIAASCCPCLRTLLTSWVRRGA